MEVYILVLFSGLLKFVPTPTPPSTPTRLFSFPKKKKKKKKNMGGGHCFRDFSRHSVVSYSIAIS